MARELGLPADRMTTIYNPFDPEVDRLAAEEPPADLVRGCPARPWWPSAA